MIRKLPLFILISVLCSSFTGVKQVNHLFIIERSKDKNVINYDLNKNSNGSLDLNNPITIHWKKTSGNIENLTWIQAKYAYGIKVTHKSKELVKFKFVSYENKELMLIKRNKGYSVILNEGNSVVEVKKIYIHFNGGSFWFPEIPQVDIEGIDTITNKNHKIVIHTK